MSRFITLQHPDQREAKGTRLTNLHIDPSRISAVIPTGSNYSVRAVVDGAQIDVRWVDGDVGKFVEFIEREQALKDAAK